ncbi:YrdB family protein [Embleya sp. NPDC050493]|uniref:YrdB family protein n=1 Tax=Embleya sp. NPDC050493 TaxID=3363989 RepID=UPI0037B393E0
MIVLYWTAMVALFLAELAVVGATAFWGFTLDAGRPLRILAGLAAPALMMFLWGRYAAANNADALTGLPRILFEVAWWGTGIAAFIAAGLLPGAIGIAVTRLTGLAAQRSKAHTQRGTEAEAKV